MERPCRPPANAADLDSADLDAQGLQPSHPSHAGWPNPALPLTLTVVKLAPDGSIVTEYPGEVVPGAAPFPWLAVRAVWRNRLVVLDGLEFHPGDILMEFFSADAWFNVFAVHAPDGLLRGWYANVTFPTRFDPAPNPPRLTWHDLFVDVLLLPNGRLSVRDEDELAAAQVAATDPALHVKILAGRDTILDRVRRRRFPFDRGRNDPEVPPMNPVSRLRRNSPLTDFPPDATLLAVDQGETDSVSRASRRLRGSGLRTPRVMGGNP